MPLSKEVVKDIGTEVPIPTTEDDGRYVELIHPITVGQATLTKLLIDPSELKGPVYFKLMARFRREYPEAYQNSLNKLTDELFLSFVIAELNPPMTVEDLSKVDFVDLAILFMRATFFAFRPRVTKEATA